MLPSCVVGNDVLHISCYLLNRVNVYPCSGRYLLTNNTLDHAPSHFKLVKTNLFIADLLGAFLHSNFTWHSRWILTLAVFDWVRHLDRYCFMMMWPGAAHSLKTTEIWCSRYTDVCYIVKFYMKLKLDHLFRKTLYMTKHFYKLLWSTHRLLEVIHKTLSYYPYHDVSIWKNRHSLCNHQYSDNFTNALSHNYNIHKRRRCTSLKYL